MRNVLMPGRDPRADYREVLDDHNRALALLTVSQMKAINRIILASFIVRESLGDHAPKLAQQAFAPTALATVMKMEAAGHEMDVVMWNKPVNLTDQEIDALVSLDPLDPEGTA